MRNASEPGLDDCWDTCGHVKGSTVRGYTLQRLLQAQQSRPVPQTRVPTLVEVFLSLSLFRRFVSSDFPAANARQAELRKHQRSDFGGGLALKRFSHF